eukprot:7373130-Pyramimonas_sp.AAC.1
MRGDPRDMRGDPRDMRDMRGRDMPMRDTRWGPEGPQQHTPPGRYNDMGPDMGPNRGPDSAD